MAASAATRRQREETDRRTVVERMPPETSEHRYERKYRIDRVPLANVELWLRQHPANFRALHQVRWINNIYFDTPSHRAVWENLNGDTDRVKTRVRWYGDLLGEINAPVLERKIRNGSVGGKQIFVLPPFHFSDVPDMSVVRAAIDEADLTERVRLDVAMMWPTLMNRYCRRYYQSGDGRFRATVDTDLDFYPAPRPSDVMLRRHPLNGTIVLEMKFSPRDAREAGHIGGHFPVRSTRNSKYVTGMQMCYPIPELQE